MMEIWKHSHRGWLLTDPIIKSNKWHIFIFIVYFYLFLYFFLYYLYGLGSNVTNPADGEFLAFAIRMSLQAVNGFRISLLSTLFCYMWSSFASTALIMIVSVAHVLSLDYVPDFIQYRENSTTESLTLFN